MKHKNDATYSVIHIYINAWYLINKIGCLDGTPTNRMSTKYFDPNGTSTGLLVHYDTSYPWHFVTCPQCPGILCPSLSQSGCIVTCDIMSTLFYLVCDILSICDIFAACFLLPLSHYVKFFPFVTLCFWCDILSMRVCVFVSPPTHGLVCHVS